VVCIQEFNYASTNGFGTSTPAAIRELIDSAFGTNFSYFRETQAGYTIPNGIISRYPIVASGSWDDGDNNINDRGFAWAQIDLPGTNDLYAVSLHLKAGSGSANEIRRFKQSAVLKALIYTNFPANALVVVGGDCNTHSQAEGCMTNFGSFLSDMNAPADKKGGTNTNAGRTERYDRVMPSYSLAGAQIPVVIGASSYASGLVFDSRVFSPLGDVSPVQVSDSGATAMQHMGIVKDFRLPVPVSNSVVVPGQNSLR
jgi:endonuclease/exonuclease/phosphatase family metal-dependent hydrolase